VARRTLPERAHPSALDAPESWGPTPSNPLALRIGLLEAGVSEDEQFVLGVPLHPRGSGRAARPRRTNWSQHDGGISSSLQTSRGQSGTAGDHSHPHCLGRLVVNPVSGLTPEFCQAQRQHHGRREPGRLTWGPKRLERCFGILSRVCTRVPFPLDPTDAFERGSSARVRDAAASPGAVLVEPGGPVAAKRRGNAGPSPQGE